MGHKTPDPPAQPSYLTAIPPTTTSNQVTYENLHLSVTCYPFLLFETSAKGGYIKPPIIPQKFRAEEEGGMVPRLRGRGRRINKKELELLEMSRNCSWVGKVAHKTW
ncbi:hypothetical protein BY996DRAFT_6552601 [Phakopsora pachyrhizi]|nr:hypothetical protein BY996DRAFT_6552601 [Phakopsora pachyrhizi]